MSLIDFETSKILFLLNLLLNQQISREHSNVNILIFPSEYRHVTFEKSDLKFKKFDFLWKNSFFDTYLNVFSLKSSYFITDRTEDETGGKAKRIFTSSTFSPLTSRVEKIFSCSIFESTSILILKIRNSCRNIFITLNME